VDILELKKWGALRGEEKSKGPTLMSILHGDFSLF